MFKAFQIFVLAFIVFFLSASSASAASRGPVSSIEEFRSLLASSHEGDIIRVSGNLVFESDQPLSTAVSVRITSAGSTPATLHNLHLYNANVSFANIHLLDTLEILGNSHVQLLHDVQVSGGEGRSGVSFNGSGTLIIDRKTSITGGNSSPGVSIHHHGGEFYASLEGSVSGGSGYAGGPGVLVSPLRSSGVMLIAGSVIGGNGTAIGGNAINFYNLSDNAFVTVSGDLRGGSGPIGGDGIQLVSVSDRSCVGISGKVKGGAGDAYGGDAIMVMNAAGASSIHLSGNFSGGNALTYDAQPGTALQMVGEMTALRVRVDNCLLEDGRSISSYNSSQIHTPSVTPLPSIISSANDVDQLESDITTEHFDYVPNHSAGVILHTETNPASQNEN